MKKKSFIRSLMVSYLWIAIFPLSVVLLIFSVNTVKNTRENVQEDIAGAARLISAQIQSLSDTMSFLSIHLVNNIMYEAKGLSYPGNSLIKEEQYYSEIHKECCSYAIQDSRFNVIFFTDQGYYISSDDYLGKYHYRYRMPGEELRKADWLEEIQNNQGKSILLPVEGDTIPLTSEKSLTLARAVRDPGKAVGYLCVSTAAGNIDDIFKIGEQSNAQAALYDTNTGRMVYHTKQFPVEELERNEGDFSSLAEKYLLIQEMDANGLVTVLVSSKKDVYLLALGGTRMLLMEGILLFCLTVCVIWYYTRKMTRPLKVLTTQMQNMTLQNLNAAPPAKEYYEEIQYLYNGYQEMQKRLDEMIRQEIASKTLQLKERLDSLQAQINPHFLYNTLNVIGIMGSESDNPNIYNACFRLSALLRYSIADKNFRTSNIQMEMENISDYLELMKLRFEHRVEYTITCEEDCYRIEVPRLILQPFVENVFEHAYSGEHKIVHVEILCKREENRVVLTIEDDGQGMEEERIQALKESIYRKQRMSAREGIQNMEEGIGVENTILRMCLFYKENFSFDIENGKNGGVKISMWIKESGVADL